MHIYRYKNLPPAPELPVRRLELKQSMRVATTTHDSETGASQASFYLGCCCGPVGEACHK